MDIYKGKIRLSGDMRNEVRKEGLTAPEVILLKRIHGDDAFVEIEKTGREPRNHYDERQRLYTEYPAAINTDAKRHYIEELFGPNHQDLPSTVPGVTLSPSPNEINVKELME